MNFEKEKRTNQEYIELLPESLRDDGELAVLFEAATPIACSMVLEFVEKRYHEEATRKRIRNNAEVTAWRSGRIGQESDIVEPALKAIDRILELQKGAGK